MTSVDSAPLNSVFVKFVAGVEKKDKFELIQQIQHTLP